MPISAQYLIQNQSSWTTATLDTTLDKAFALMIEHDYSQLPVVDQDFKALGLVTSESITRALLNLGAGLKELRVKDALLKLLPHQADEDLLDLLDSLNDSATLIADSNGKLIGIITVYDTNQFFRQRAEDIVRVEDIENTLKEHLRAAYDSQEEDSPALQAAIASLGSSHETTRKDCHSALKALCSLKTIEATHDELAGIVDKRFPPAKQAKTLDHLTLYDFIQLGQKAWDKLGPVLNIPVKSWAEMMHAVREIRNKLMHFRGDVSVMERDQLRYCADWYKGHQPARRKSEPTDTAENRTTEPVQELPVAVSVKTDDTVTTGYFGEGSIAAKYAPLATFLYKRMHTGSRTLHLQFNYLEQLLQQKLPKAAREHLSWWYDYSAHTSQWLGAGWQVDWVDLEQQTVRFKRAIDLAHVSLESTWEVAFWCREFECAEPVLREAWENLGSDPEAIQAYLATIKHSTSAA